MRDGDETGEREDTGESEDAGVRERVGEGGREGVGEGVAAPAHETSPGHVFRSVTAYLPALLRPVRRRQQEVGE